ncbi:DUF72 domain-containing protein [Paenibacillus sp. GCM10023252]|uniref:DUF72 domain-containing protein n=1 Tax=Paenibacillus sp. GCM10023252 TaxID=3252649 RepID=UPI00361DB6AC
MIHIGLAGWGDHTDLYAKGVSARDRLKIYSTYHSCVEVDSTFYAIQAEKVLARWAEEDTPPHFRFVIKAYQGMTGHLRGPNPFPSEEAMFEAFRASIAPVAAAGKLASVLFQYPPWFDCSKPHVDILREARERMQGLPVSLEFRHQSWFDGEMKDKTLAFMEQEGWIHSVCDEPQAGAGSIPIVLQATDKGQTIVRMHGRNAEHWNGGGGPNWREVRYLYNYSEQELSEWKDRLLTLEGMTKEIYVIFNNNSGGHAAANAARLMEMLGQETKPFAPKQLELF